MEALEYPFDADNILTQKKKLKRQLLEKNTEWLEKRIAILGGATTADIRLMLELFLLHQGIKPEFYESEYNQYYQDAVFPNEALETFAPDIVYVCTSNRNVTAYPRLSDSEAEVEQLLREQTEKFRHIWESLEQRFHCPVIQNNFEMPLFRLMGNRDASDIHGAVNFLTRLNMEFYQYAREHDNFYICDINYISADYGLKEWADPFYWHMYKYALNVSAIPYLAHNVANIIKSIFGKNKKGLVLDLDNTLWGGVIGDDGVDNIVLGPEESEGQAYMEFQAYLKALKQLGVVLNVCSKNDYENAVAGLEHPDSILKPDEFISIKANWEPKDRNFREIAEELKLLPESLVFVDDNPVERHIITAQMKGVAAPRLQSVTGYIETLDRSGFFETTVLSQDDMTRNEMYRENLARARLEEGFADYGEYLRSLEMKAVIRSFEPVYMARIAQLTNKSNQFNLTTRRYTQNEIEELAGDDDYITLYGKLSDRFGDNGVVSVVIGHVVDGECRIDLWIMSCRVLKRDMEYAMMDALAHMCEERGITGIRGYYYPTAKNNMVRDFYGLQGFEKVSADDEGNTVWHMDLTHGYAQKNTVIDVETENDKR